MIAAVIGGRDFNDYLLLCTTLDKYPIHVIVSGGAKGADSLGEKYAKERDIQTIIFYPDWDRFGKSAGYKRNKQIVESSEIVIAFWDGVSKGTKHSIDIARQLGKELIIINYGKN